MPLALASSRLAARIDSVLPQTQCTRCGYVDCASYAHAVATQEVDINQCPPGGAEGVRRIAALMGREPLPLNAIHGTETHRSLAVIDEDWCIGCTLCLEACPTDAILGASKQMHTVTKEHCTGCELCLPVCPVDCIALINASGTATGWAAWSNEQANNAQDRYRQHQERSWSVEILPATVTPATPSKNKKATIAAALVRARQQRSL